MLFFGRRLGWSAVGGLPENFSAIGVNAWWALPPRPSSRSQPIVVARRPKASGAVMALLRLPRAVGTIVAALLAGALLSFGYYPALAAQLSPKEVFESYAQAFADRTSPWVSSVSAEAAPLAYYKGGEVETFADALRAYSWLTQRVNQRRWLIVQADDLPKLNSLYRKNFAHNLLVLDGQSSQIPSSSRTSSAITPTIAGTPAST